MFFKKIKKNIEKKIKKQKGFVILIAVMVSMILLSIGTFIATVAMREIQLSSSLKESQKAFFVTDSVLECALFKEFKGGGFSKEIYTTHTASTAPGGGTSLSCNGKDFDWSVSVNTTLKDKNGNDYDVVKHVYYISLSSVLNDTGLYPNIYTKNEIISNNSYVYKQPYVKLIVYKAQDYNHPSKIQVYGHNIMAGSNVLERAMQVVW